MTKEVWIETSTMRLRYIPTTKEVWVERPTMTRLMEPCIHGDKAKILSVDESQIVVELWNGSKQTINLKEGSIHVREIY